MAGQRRLLSCAREPSASGNGSDIVRYQTATGTREILVAASRLIPAGEKAPLPVEDYTMSSDGQQVLVFTNSKTVWRQNTRGDYWVLDLTSGALRKLGGDAPASSLMFAKFSPDNTKVGYVRGNNVYVEDLASGKITQLTQRRLWHYHQRHFRLGERGGVWTSAMASNGARTAAPSRSGNSTRAAYRTTR